MPHLQLSWAKKCIVWEHRLSCLLTLGQAQHGKLSMNPDVSLSTLLIFALPMVSVQADCVSDFNEESIFGELLNGQSVTAPFNYAYLVDDGYEPALRREVLDQTSLQKHVDIFIDSYDYAISIGAEQITENNGRAINVIFRSPDSGFNIEYRFSEVNDCWLFVGFTNQST